MPATRYRLETPQSPDAFLQQLESTVAHRGAHPRSGELRSRGLRGFRLMIRRPTFHLSFDIDAESTRDPIARLQAHGVVRARNPSGAVVAVRISTAHDPAWITGAVIAFVMFALGAGLSLLHDASRLVGFLCSSLEIGAVILALSMLRARRALESSREKSEIVGLLLSAAPEAEILLDA